MMHECIPTHPPAPSLFKEKESLPLFLKERGQGVSSPLIKLIYKSTNKNQFLKYSYLSSSFLKI
jgi:hypothetical protein